MFPHLQIYDPRERLAVGLADLALRAAALTARAFPSAGPAFPPRRVLLLRLERIGDLLMTLDAIAAVRDLLPDAAIDLVVGSWNREVANLLPHVSRVETLDAPWLARDQAGVTYRALLERALAWKRGRYDLAINFEGDIRSNVLAALARIPVRAGFAIAGGGPLLTIRGDFDPRAHTSTNVRRLVEMVGTALGLSFGGLPPSADRPTLPLPAESRARAGATLKDLAGKPLIGLHASGGRDIKQWHPDRFGEAVGRVAVSHGAAVVLTGTEADRPLVAAARRAVPEGVPVADVSGSAGLVDLAAILERLDVFVTGDTGPMHLAAAVATPVVAVFGPSDPSRYGPLGTGHRIVRVQLPCSPCNRVRLPPERCRGHVPDCLEGIGVAEVARATEDVLAHAGAARGGRRRDAGRRDGEPA
jgi:lipopolysaccharide heptosyltransferase II